jgi:thiamine biosynthesis lipoprotein
MKVHHRQLQSMGTRLDLVIAGVEKNLCDDIEREVKAELGRIEGMLSIYNPDSAISLLNREAHISSITLEPELLAIFHEIKNYHIETGGYFDITLKPVSDYLRDHEGRIFPDFDEISEATGMDKVLVDKMGVRFSHQGMKVDLGGYGKGYAIKKLLPILESHELSHALISFGESLVYGWGTHPYGETWRISVPVGVGEDPAQFDLKNESLSTSGNSLNNQKKFANSGHIVNPHSLNMVAHRGLVSVKSEDPVRSEIYSTALFSSGREKSKEVLHHAGDLQIKWINTGDLID